MKKQIYTVLTICVLALTIFTALIGEVNAQPRKGSKPNDRAKKLAVQGDQFYKQKDYRSAINKYAEAIVISPNYPQAHYWKGYAHHLLKEYDAAIEDLSAALDQGFTPIKVYETRWEDYLYKKDYDASLNDVQQALKIEPANNYFLVSLGDVSRLKGDYETAVNAYKKAMSGSQNKGDLYYYIAFSYYNLNDTVQQNAAAGEAIKYNTNFPGETYVLMADALVKNKQPAEAIAAYERALNVKPDMPEVYTVLSSLYQSQSRINDAIATIRKGIKLYPDNGEMFVNLTWFYSLADRNAEAVNYGQQAVKLMPENYMAHTNLCRAYNDMKLYSQALVSCNKGLALQPNDGETFLYLARINDSQNKSDTAKQYYKKAVVGLSEVTSSNPENSDGWYLLGNAYYYDNQVDKAIEAYKRSLDLNPNFPKAILNLGYMYVASGKMPLAKEQYNILLKMHPPSAEKLKAEMDKK